MFAKVANDQFLKTLDRLQEGRFELIMPNGREYVFQGKQPGLTARMVMNDWRVPANLVGRGDEGFALDYSEGRWATDNLQNLIAFALRNEEAVKNFIFGSTLFKTLSNISYLFKSNTMKGSRRNIQAHYDLGNDFYQLWLDPSMTYSSALYKTGQEDLLTAQNNKYDRIVDRFDMQSGSVLEIGCGWGGFAERALTRGDFGIKGITLSDEQKNYAENRLGHSASIALEDYRVQEGTYNNIVSIEMFEAVGEKYWKTYFSKIKSLLGQNGKAVIQTITIDDKRFNTYRRGHDFIRSFIFPGGMLPSPALFEREARNAGLRVTNRHDFGADYAKTLAIWLKNFDDKSVDIKSLGYSENFMRLWRFYLAACAAGFQTGRTDVSQFELQHV